MGKFLLEAALFAGILCQIALLAERARDGTAPAAALAAPAMIAAYDAASVFAAAPGGDYRQAAFDNRTILEEMAQREAVRIVQTGDYENFSRQVEKYTFSTSAP